MTKPIMVSRRTVLASCLALPGFSQNTPTFSTELKMVGILANVRDKKGHLIRDLGQNDFTVLEDGRPQTIRYFAKQSDLPLVIGLMVDTSMSQERVVGPERTACFHFLDEVLRENKDKIFIVQFDMSVDVRQEMTSSWKDLNAALGEVDTPTRNQLRNQMGGGTLLYDALLTGAKMMEPEHGRKALLVMTDGVDTGSEADLNAALDAAVRADTLTYSILFSDEGYYGVLGGGGGRKVLERLSKDSGGGFFAVSKKLTIDQVFDVIQDELRSQYAFGYISDKPVKISEFRRIDVKTRQKDLTVQARDRYWARP
ncbi:MAG TPA: VWA domain-containing protein [Bryobacteraceae bacterium]|nr:VWA domain-containing protein [Bryobacteraceae bacterium]